MPAISALVPSLLWAWLFFHLHYTWSLNQQYNYGWAVPFLAIFLFVLRWQTRPAPDDASDRLLVRLRSWAILLALLPIRVIEEANPDWRFLSWVFALLVATFSLSQLQRTGGRRWAMHFAFPICFALVAVPWPVQLENAVVHSLTRAVAYVAVEAASWLGIGAYQLGNVIQLANGFVGVDEACSGVKTLQAAIMLSLFLGELLRLSVERRVVLVFAGCLWVFACNILRATTLVLIAARSGIPALEHWHDLVGVAVLVLGMGGLVGAAFFLSKRVDQPSAAATLLPARNIPFAEIAGALVWLVLIFASAEIWYRAHERGLIERPAWTPRWPENARAMPIAETTAAILHYNEASSAEWRGSAGDQWWGFFGRWAPRRAALQLVRSHSPEICLPAVGREFQRELPSVDLTGSGLQLRFRVYEFVQQGQPLFVFVCIQEDKTTAGVNGEFAAAEWSARGRLRAAWNGERNLGQRLLELAAIGFADAAGAHEGLREAAREIFREAGLTD